MLMKILEAHTVFLELLHTNEAAGYFFNALQKKNTFTPAEIVQHNPSIWKPKNPKRFEKTLFTKHSLWGACECF